MSCPHSNTYLFRQPFTFERAPSSISRTHSSVFTRTPSALSRASIDNGNVLNDAEIAYCESFAISSSTILLGAHIGSGACGEVHRAGWRNKEVAIKMLRYSSEADSQEVKDLVKECSLMCRSLVHPNIVGFYGICIDGDLPWLVIEYMGGGSLDLYYRSQRRNTVDWKPQRRQATKSALDVAQSGGRMEGWVCVHEVTMCCYRRHGHRDCDLRGLCFP